jgi:hypothetical protein
MLDPGRCLPDKGPGTASGQGEELHHPGDPEGGCDRHVGRILAGHDLVHQNRQRHEQHGGQHEPVPDRDESDTASIEAPQDVARGFAQDIGVLEGHRQQGKEGVEGDGRQDEEHPPVSLRNLRSFTACLL